MQQCSSNDNPCISVIVPAYNADAYLSECLDSILRQTEVAEVVLVNDGSIDKTFEIAKAYAGRDSRIQVVDKPNGGVSTARNLGLTLVTQPYVMFVDADDVLPPNAAFSLLASIERYGTELAYGEFAVLKGGSIGPATEELHSFAEGVVDSRAALVSLAIMAPKSISGSCCRALFAASLLERSTAGFPEGIAISEDYDFMLQVLAAKPRISVTHEVVYWVRRGSVSVTQCYIPTLKHDMEFVNAHLLKACEGDAELMGLYYGSAANTAWNICSNAYSVGTPLSRAERYALIKRTMEEYRDIVGNSKGIDGLPKAKRMLLALGSKAPRLLWAALELRGTK